jgi:plasmid stability protein
MPAHHKWTEKEVQEIITAYLSGEGVTAISKRYHVNHNSVTSKLKEYNIIIRTNAENRRTCECDYHYFQVIDTQEKAYWLGFLTADGCITTGNRVTLNLGITDYSHLIKFRNALQATQIVSTNTLSCAFVVRSNEMVTDLATHGLFPNKTFSTKPSEILPHLAKHYWRGIIDGDGHIAKSADRLTICGDYDIVLAFQSFVLSHCSKVKAKIYRQENIFGFTVGRETTHFMLNLLYKDATVFLNRKYEIAQQVFR